MTELRVGCEDIPNYIGICFLANWSTEVPYAYTYVRLLKHCPVIVWGGRKLEVVCLASPNSDNRTKDCLHYIVWICDPFISYMSNEECLYLSYYWVSLLIPY